MPKEIQWTSEITEIRKNTLFTRGIDQKTIISEFSYEEMVYLLLLGKRPNATEAQLLRAVIVSHCSHGITGQSTMAVRMAADCRSSFLNSALAGFLTGSGDYHQEALPRAMEMLKEASVAPDLDAYLVTRLQSKRPLYGYGHRFHSKDPRAITLMELCKQHKYIGKHIQTARKIEEIVGPKRGKFMNIEAAGGSILLDMGIVEDVAPLVILVGRAPMYAATYLERLRSGAKPFQRLSVYDVVPEKRTV
jgi:citrate synthase